MGKCPRPHQTYVRAHELPGISRHHELVNRPQDLHVHFAREPTTPADDFAHRLILGMHDHQVEDGDGGVVWMIISLHVEVQESVATSTDIFRDPDMWSLCLHVEAPSIPSGGTFDTKLATYVGFNDEAPDAPLWVSEIQGQWRHPSTFSCPLDWICNYVRRTLGQTSRRHPHVIGPWWRFWRYLNTVMTLHEDALEAEAEAGAMEVDDGVEALQHAIDDLHLLDMKYSDDEELTMQLKTLHI